MKEKASKKRKAGLSDIDKMRTKQMQFVKAIEMIETESSDWIELVEKNSNLTFVIKGNGLKRKSTESKKDLLAL